MYYVFKKSFITTTGPLAPGLNFVKNSLTYFYSLLISSSTLHLIAECLASVTADTSIKVFGLTQQQIEPCCRGEQSLFFETPTPLLLQESKPLLLVYLQMPNFCSSFNSCSLSILKQI